MLANSYDIWIEENKQPTIATLCKDLDQAIGKGISPGIITELCGPPGSGKTQICIQLCANVQIPTQLGGFGGKALYFDTNFGFHPHRLKEMATACTQHCRNIVETLRKDLSEDVEGFTAEIIMENVYYKYISDSSSLIEELDTLENLLKAGEKIKLVVVDSLSFLIKCNTENSLERLEVDYTILTKLHVLAYRYKLAVVITNDCTTRINPSNSTDSTVVPALGECHSHKINQRIVLGAINEEQPGIFIASIEKSLFRPRSSIKFRITEAGIRRVRKN
ncbi:uncharacterized protein LOC129775669 [Toxorhynchites rutilus septentrionalis]|uniref:uncharacterized protein LOC129775669 n=1 Tax=Toxorhynchites rutilus septentrionalis TaxID=329112 RepID=UPI002479F87E|nr:uncharacterized protein LOC129775669 [Toxorhynchites rutilus septentrionalis]